MQDSVLKQYFAEAKLFSGQPGADKWLNMLDSPAKIEALRKRVILEFADHNREIFTLKDPVELHVWIKNVPNLIVKVHIGFPNVATLSATNRWSRFSQVYEIDTFNYLRENDNPVDISINLDGLVPSTEYTRSYSRPPIERYELMFCELILPI